MTSKCPFTAEEESVTIIEYLRKAIFRKYGSGKPRRIFHAKTIGVVKGTLTVDELSSNKRLAVGLFATPGVYDNVTIRFTKGNSTIVPDGKIAIHGMAIKIAIPGNANKEEKGQAVQDIILTDNPVFYPYQLDALHPAMKSLLDPQWIVRNYYRAKIGFKDALAAFGFLRKRKNPANLMEEIYYSGTPYKFGEKDKIKWSAWPSKVVCPVVPETPHGENFLSERMRCDLETNIPPSGTTDTVLNQPPGSSKETINYRVRFTLCVQFQEDENTEPIEDCSVEWKTKFHPVGVIKIPAQQVEFIENNGIDHGLWYSPANALEEHAPIGFVNKVRAQVYTTLAKERLFAKDNHVGDKDLDSGSKDGEPSIAEIKIVAGNKSMSEV